MQYTSKQRENKSSGWQLIAVQSISCVVVILIVLLFRVIGGKSFTQLRQSFNKAIMSNSIIATLAALIEAPSEDPDKEESGSKSTTVGSTTVPSESATDKSNPTDETSGTTGTETTGTIDKEPPGTGASVTASTTLAVTSGTKATGGNDIPVSQRKILYAPEGATFVPIKINRVACKPLETGKVTSYFGYRSNPTSGEEGFHQGLDIAADYGTPIHSLFFGVVSEVGQNKSYGNYVEIYHGNGLKVLYAHCSQILVGEDAVIRAGEVVARMGSTGDSTGPHLHVEVTLNGTAYDPSGVIQIKDYV